MRQIPTGYPQVTDNNDEIFFKIKRTTALSKLMNAFCDRQGMSMNSVRFLFEGTPVDPTDNLDTVRSRRSKRRHLREVGVNTAQLDMQDGDTLVARCASDDDAPAAALATARRHHGAL
jgi:hypothetical protein